MCVENTRSGAAPCGSSIDIPARTGCRALGWLRTGVFSTPSRARPENRQENRPPSPRDRWWIQFRRAAESTDGIKACEAFIHDAARIPYNRLRAVPLARSPARALPAHAISAISAETRSPRNPQAIARKMKGGMNATASSFPVGAAPGNPTLRSVELAGPAGRLEALLNTGAPDAACAALICHPNPAYGGTMHHKVVYRAMKVLNDPEWGLGISGSALQLSRHRSEPGNARWQSRGRRCSGRHANGSTTNSTFP